MRLDISRKSQPRIISFDDAEKISAGDGWRDFSGLLSLYPSARGLLDLKV
jgi:hypothetical protein